MIYLCLGILLVSGLSLAYTMLLANMMQKIMFNVEDMHKATIEAMNNHYRQGLHDGSQMIIEQMEAAQWTGPTGMEN